jgi:hypothetical protein
MLFLNQQSGKQGVLEDQTYVSEFTATIDSSIHKIQETLEKQTNTLKVSVTEMKQEMSSYHSTMDRINMDVGSLKEDTTNIKQDLIHMNADVGSLKQDVTNIKQELNCFKVRLENMDNSLSHIDTNVDQMRELLANSSLKRKGVGSSAIGAAASTAGNQCSPNVVVPEELKLILNMGVDGNQVDFVFSSNTSEDAMEQCNQISSFLNLFIFIKSFLCNKANGRINIVPKVIEVGDLHHTMEQSSLLIGVALKSKFNKDLPVLALIREGMEFFVVFGYWNSGIGINEIYIYHRSDLDVSREVSKCAGAVCKAHMNTIPDDDSNCYPHPTPFEKLFLPMTSSFREDIEVSHFYGPYTSSQAYSFAASFATSCLLFESKLDLSQSESNDVKKFLGLLKKYVKALLGKNHTMNLSGKLVKQSLQNIAECCEDIIKSEPLNATVTLDTLEVGSLFKFCYENFSLSSEKMYDHLQVAGKSEGIGKKSTSVKRKSRKENEPVKTKGHKRNRITGGNVAN